MVCADSNLRSLDNHIVFCQSLTHGVCSDSNLWWADNQRLIKIKPPVPFSKFLAEVVFLIKLLSTSMYQDRWCVLIAIFGDRTIKGSLALLDTDQTSTLQIGRAVRPNNLLEKDETRTQTYFLPWWKPCFCQLCEHLLVRSLDGGDTHRTELPWHADCENLRGVSSESIGML